MNAPLTPTPSQQRTSWFVVLFALSVAPVIYVFIARMVAPGRPPSPLIATLHPAFMALAGVQLILGAFILLRARVPAPTDATTAVGEVAPPAQFQARSVLGMAMFEAVSIYGFLLAFLGNDPAECVVWSAVSMIGMLGVALPVGVAYWRDLGQASTDPGTPRG